MDIKRVRVKAGEVSAIVAQIIGTHYPAGINQEVLEREVMAALSDCAARLVKTRDKLTPPPARDGVRAYVASAVSSYPRGGLTAREAWEANPGGWTLPEITDALERLIGDGDVSFRIAGGEKFYYSPSALNNS